MDTNLTNLNEENLNITPEPIEEKNILGETISQFSSADVTLVDNSNVKIHLTHQQNKYLKKVWRYSLERDKKYRGPLSLFTLRIVAWLCIICSQLVIICQLAGSLANLPALTTVSSYLEYFASLSMPAFLLANFAYIIQNKRDSIRILNVYFFMMLAVAGIFYFFCLHFVVGLAAKAFKTDYNTMFEMLSTLIMLALNTTFKFNIFVDLFICTLFVFFFLYEPKKIFVGKKIVFFRMLSIIPVGYEFATIILKVLSVVSDFTIPFLMTPFMPTKCPVTFLAFLFTVFFELRRKRKYMKYNGNPEAYDRYFATNKNSWMFAKSAAKCFAIAGLLDLILFVIFSVVIPFSAGEDVALIEACTNAVNVLELGDSVGLLLFAPFILLFSYNKMFKPSKMDIFIPAISVAVIIIIYMEAIYQALVLLAFK